MGVHRKSPEEEGLLSALIALFCVYEEPLSGYGVRSRLKDWNVQEYLSVSPATIYRSLGRMEEQGLLSSRTEKNGRYPASRVYKVTATGRKRYRELMKNVGAFRRGPHPLMPLIGLGSFLPVAQRVRLARDWSASSRAALEELRQRLRNKTPGDVYGKPFAEWLMLDHEAARLQADIRWLDKYIRLMEAGKA